MNMNVIPQIVPQRVAMLFGTGFFEWLCSNLINLKLSYHSMLEEGIDDNFIV